MNRWFPVARSEELVPRHVAQTQLLGREIALWRADSGTVNAWENRCPHRGVRLSIGINTGAELRCQYHGWRFASGSGQCTFIPAHPRQKPASVMHAGVFGAIERHQFVWVSLDPRTAVPDLPMLPSTPATSLRSIFVRAPAAAVADSLLRGYRIDSVTDAAVVAHDAFMLTATANSQDHLPTVSFMLQPVAESQTIIHAISYPSTAAADRLGELRHHNAMMSALRDDVESGYAAAKRIS